MAGNVSIGAVTRSYGGHGDEASTSHACDPIVPVCSNLVLAARGNYLQNITLISQSCVINSYIWLCYAT
jgi:hypothetical protein